MAYISLSEAARLVGKDRRTLERHVRQGKLSVVHNAAGCRTFETSELMRVYGELSHLATAANVAHMYDTPHHDGVAEMRQKMALLEAENETLRQRVEDKDKNLDDMRQALRLLEDKTERDTKKGWFNRILGKK